MTLAELVGSSRRPLPATVLAPLFEQLGRALANRHAKGGVHGRSGRANRSHLQCGRPPSPAARAALDGSATDTGVAPEQVLGTTTAASDIYGLGLTMWRALTGKDFQRIATNGSQRWTPASQRERGSLPGSAPTCLKDWAPW